jgi:hypothetical protein
MTDTTTITIEEHGYTHTPQASGDLYEIILQFELLLKTAGFNFDGHLEIVDRE